MTLGYVFSLMSASQKHMRSMSSSNECFERHLARASIAGHLEKGTIVEQRAFAPDGAMVPSSARRPWTEPDCDSGLRKTAEGKWSAAN